MNDTNDTENNVIPFFAANAAENPDHVLEQAKGVYEKILIIGLDKEGYMDVRASMNLQQMQALWLLESFKLGLLSGRYNKDD